MDRYPRIVEARLLIAAFLIALIVLCVLLIIDSAKAAELAAMEKTMQNVNVGAAPPCPPSGEEIHHRDTEAQSEEFSLTQEQIREILTENFNEQLQLFVWDYAANRGDQGFAIGSAVCTVAKAKQLDPLLILAIIEVESGFNANARGGAGEYGLMQIHPCWINAAAIGSPSRESLESIEGNIAAGCAIFRRCYTDDYLSALGHYNTGDGRNAVYEHKVDAVYTRIQRVFLWRLMGVR